GVEVGHTTLISGDGEHAVRTGVTAVLPRGKSSNDPVFAGWWTLNGNGEMTGTTWVEESGLLEGPVMITNTHSVGVVRDAVIAWQLNRGRGGQAQPWSLPVVAETWDGTLNDINGFHVKPEHVFQALENAAPGTVAEGNVGGGTGMICHGSKGGIGSASRKLRTDAGGYTLGVLVQCNYRLRRQLRIAGVPVGQEVGDQSVGPSVASYDSSVAVRDRRTERMTDSPSNRPTGPTPNSAPSSSSSPLTPRCCRTSSSAWRAAPRSRSAAWAASPATAPATSSSPSPLPTATPAIPSRSSRLRCCPTTASARCLKPPCRPPRKPSSTPWSPPKP